MGFFKKSKKIPGWLAIGLQADGVRAVHVIRTPSSLPVVQSVNFYAAERSNDSLRFSLSLLNKLSKEWHVADYCVTTVLAFGEYQLLSVDAPNVPREELKTAIRWRLKDMLDFHVDDATIDVLAIPYEKNAPARNQVMYAVAARNQLIEQRQTDFATAKISLTTIDVPEMAQRNISVLLEPDAQALALLSFGTDGGVLTLTYAGELYMSRRIDITLSQLIQAVGDERSALFDRITLELQRSLDHFDRQFHWITLSKLLLFPNLDVIAQLKEHVLSTVYLPVETLNLTAIFDFSKVPELQQPDSQQAYFTVLGAALRLEGKVL